jgi:hypothetical protein
MGQGWVAETLGSRCSVSRAVTVLDIPGGNLETKRGAIQREQPALSDQD